MNQRGTAGAVQIGFTATTAANDDIAAICEACGRRAKDLLRCGRCRTATFCDDVCQRRVWHAHKPRCGAMGAAAESIAALVPNCCGTAFNMQLFLEAVRRIHIVEGLAQRRVLVKTFAARLAANVYDLRMRSLVAVAWSTAEFANVWPMRGLCAVVARHALQRPRSELTPTTVCALGGQLAQASAAYGDGGFDCGALRAIAWAAGAVSPKVAAAWGPFIGSELIRLVDFGPGLGLGDQTLLAARAAATAGAEVDPAARQRLRNLAVEPPVMLRALRLDPKEAAERAFVDAWLSGKTDPSLLPDKVVWEDLPMRRQELECSLTLPAVVVCAAQHVGGLVGRAEIVIHFLGAVERHGVEGDMDLGWLRNALARSVGYPDLQLRVAIVGFLQRSRGVEATARYYAGRKAGWPGIEVTCHHGLYHELMESLPMPDISVLGNAGLEAHFPQWAPTIALLRDHDVPMVATGYTDVVGMTHDVPTTLVAAKVLAVKVIAGPARNFAVRTLPDEGRCYCSRQVRPKHPNGIASSGFWVLFRGVEDDITSASTVMPPRTAVDFAAAWRLFRFEVLRMIAYEERKEGHYDAMGSVSTFLDCVDAGEEAMSPEDSIKELVARAMKRPMSTSKIGLEKLGFNPFDEAGCSVPDPAGFVQTLM